MNRESVWGYSSSPDAEQWSGECETREEAIAEGRAEYEGEEFWIVEGKRLDPARFMPDPDRILDEAGERAFDEVGDIAEDFPETTKEARDELAALLVTWARKHISCEFWQAVGKPERIKP